VEVGKLADLVLLDADPLVAISNTTRIATVVANGRLFTRSDLQRLIRTANRAAATPARE
jgi:imidazolonepropionase-like amidohydrolase